MPADPERPFCDPDTPPQWIRPRHFRIVHVDLDVRIDLERERVEGSVRHRVELLPHGRAEAGIDLDQHDLVISAVTIDGSPAAWSVGDGRLSVALPRPRPAVCEVAIAFAADHPGKGLFFVAPAAGRVAMAWTQGAMEDHSHWFPCFDNPNNLSTYRLAVTHRSALVAVANGRQVERRDLGDGWTRTVHVQDQAHVLYLVNVVVGDLIAVADVGSAAVPIAHWLPRGHEDKAPAMFRATAFALRWLGDYIGVAYPWACYGHVVVHRFMWGGMENTTLTTITDRVLMDAADQARDEIDCDRLVIHELVHQWFGDLLTMKAWSDIWLNESFATYLEARGTAAWCAQSRRPAEPTHADDVLAIELWDNRATYLGEDRQRYRRALVTNRYIDAYELFDRVAYEKGSLVLHHLCCFLGDERFRAALKRYVERHAHDLVETADWRQACEDATGEPLDWFFAQWVYRAGHPRLKVRVRHDAGARQVVIEIEQVGVASDLEAWRLPCALAWALPDGQIQRQELDITRAKSVIAVPCAAAPVWVALDPDGHLPVEWDEDAGVEELLLRLADRRLGAQARARAASVLAGKHPTPRLVAGLGAVAAGDDAELVRREAIAALGELRDAVALDALTALWPRLSSPRLRRAVAAAVGRHQRSTVAADRLIAWADAEPSPLTVGALLTARGVVEVPGATPLLRARMARPSWNDQLRASAVRGLGACGEPAAIDEALSVLANPTEPDHVRQAAAAAVGALGARHLLARERALAGLEAQLDSPVLHLRSATAAAVAALGDPRGRAALGRALERERFGNVRRVLRESLEQLGRAAAATTAVAALEKRLAELEQAKKAMELRLEALEKRGPG